MAARSYQRKLKNFLIYPGFQLKMVIVQLILLLGMFGVILAQVFSSLEQVRNAISPVPLPATHAYSRLIEMQWSTLFSGLMTVFLVGFILISLASVYLSFRLAGPIYRLRKYFFDISKTGSFPEEELRFRKGDFFSDLPSVVNQAMSQLKKN